MSCGSRRSAFDFFSLPAAVPKHAAAIGLISRGPCCRRYALSSYHTSESPPVTLHWITLGQTVPCCLLANLLAADNIHPTAEAQQCPTTTLPAALRHISAWLGLCCCNQRDGTAYKAEEACPKTPVAASAVCRLPGHAPAPHCLAWLWTLSWPGIGRPWRMVGCES